MIDGILSIIVGVIGFSLLFAFIQGVNTTGMSTTDTLILGFIPTFALLAVLYGAFRLVTANRSKGI